MPFLKHKVFKYFFRAMLGLFTLLLISCLLFLWRLSSGPIQLDSLTPSIQKIVAGLPGEFEVQVKGIELIWDRQLNSIQLVATELTLVGEDDLRIVAAPTARISLSIPALMSRVIALSAIELRGVSVHVIRNKDGSLQLGKSTGKVNAETSKPEKVDDGDGEFHDLTSTLTNTFKVLESAPDPGYPLSYLKTLDIQGELTAENRKLDMEFRFVNCDFSFRGLEGSIAGDLALSIESPPPLAGIDLDISLDAKGKDIDANINFSGVNLADLSTIHAGLVVLEKVNLTLDGMLSSKITLPDTIHSAELDLHSDTGSVALEPFVPQPIEFRSFNLKAGANPVEGKLELSQLNLTLGNDHSSGPILRASGVASKLDDSISVSAETILEHLAIDDLDKYWPPDLVTGTRRWLTANLKDGHVDRVKLDIGMQIPSGPGGELELEKLEGEIDYSNLSVYFFRPMPPATGVTGSGTFNAQGFYLSISEGLIEGINLGPGEVKILGLDVKQVTLDVKTSVNGEIADALALLEPPPIKLEKVLRFDPADSGGQLNADFSIALPLKSGLSPSEIDYHVSAKLSSASIQNILNDLSIKNGTLDIYNDFNRLTLDGSFDLAGIPITLAWESNRNANGAMVSSFNASTTEISPGNFETLGFPAGTYLSGSVAAELNAEIRPGGAFDGKIDVDLTRGELSLPAIHWKKPPGEKGSAQASISISEEKQWSIRDFNINAGTLAASGGASYNPADSSLAFTLDSVGLGRTLLRDIEALLEPGQNSTIYVAGGQLDLEPLIKGIGNNPETGEKEETDTISVGAQAVQETDTGTLNINIANLEKVFFRKEQALDNVGISLAYSGDEWQKIHINGQYPVSATVKTLEDMEPGEALTTPGTFSFDFGPSVSGQHPLSVGVDNLGSMLAVTLDNHMINGGRLSVTGESPGGFLQSPVSAEITLHEFMLVDAPLVAQVLNFASLRQTLNTFNSEGLSIKSLSGDLSLSGNRLSSNLLRVNGGMLGATISGHIALDEKTMNLQGSVIPLATIGEVIGKIKPLKEILMGKEGKGIMALDYSVVGDYENPEVDVNPGSLLTPGGLRDIFTEDDPEQKPDA